MIGIGMPISQSKMERITTNSSAPAQPQQWFADAAVPAEPVLQSANAAVAGSALCSRLPSKAAWNMMAAA
jgi:hypothetical protein